MKKLFRSAIILVLVLSMLMGLCVTGYAASPVPYSGMSDSYKGSVYYQNLMKVNLGSNQITNLVNVAVSQLGYTEGASKNDLDGENSGSKSNYTEYGKRLGKNGYAWCCAFVSWCIYMAGIPTSVMPNKHAGCSNFVQSLCNNYGGVWHDIDSGYKPKAGDILFYQSMGGNYSYYVEAARDANGVPKKSSHVGIVVKDYDPATGKFGVIEGNGPGYVRYLERGTYVKGLKADGSSTNALLGVVTPAYTTGTGSQYDGSKVDESLVVTLTVPTDSKYTAKQFVGSTNACVVTRIYKTSGSNITKSGLILSKADGTVIKKYTDDVTGLVKKSTTVFHSWYDINEELGVTLTPGTTYKYQFFAVVNGKTFYGNTYSFTTTGTRPSYTVSFNANGGSVSPASKTVYAGDVYGNLPEPTREGYIFQGWYTSASGGSIVNANTNVNLSGGQTLYAHWTVDDEVQYDEQPPVQTYTVYFYVNGSVMKTMEVTNGQKYGTLPEYSLSGMVFEGWYTSVNGGTRITADSTVNLSANQTLYARYSAAAVEYELILWIDVPVYRLDGKVNPIDSLGTTPAIINSRTMLPIRCVIEAMGGKVAWDAATKTVTLTKGDEQLNLRIGTAYAWDSSKTYALDSAPVIVNNRTLLPVRAVVEYFGGKVAWDGSLKAVTITFTN
ncbi:MAG: InlB B-repeat-containing protein [Oscillospiraceae bacterium]|nr:InlB B-repeat-containing protein [Oscillospiraceae bacterium]